METGDIPEQIATPGRTNRNRTSPHAATLVTMTIPTEYLFTAHLEWYKHTFPPAAESRPEIRIKRGYFSFFLEFLN